ncbi:unnamed protein product [Somion occarium]|uniref:Uncharacterized protein n=1 Tax=Somion occarium TaxID=3059160 RepID=A0ABP1DTZ9_9APHY
MSSRSSQEAGPSSGVGPLLANKLPSIRILRPPPGRGSPKVDERCFTYCSQTIGGRINQTEPWCRTVCVRRVFDHEVKRTIATFDEDHAEIKTVDAKYPLPPEGQKALRFFPWVHEDPNESHEEGSHARGPGRAYGPKKDLRFWQEGWYLWMSKSRWGAQERLDLMMQDLEHQAEWQQYKDKVISDWASYERKQQSQAQSQLDRPPPMAGEAFTAHDPLHTATHTHQHDDSSLPPPPPFPDYVSQSLLIHLPPPIEPPFEKVLGPTGRVLAKTWESIENGQQRQLFTRIVEKAFTQEPLILAQNVCRKVWEMWTQNNRGNEENS